MLYVHETRTLQQRDDFVTRRQIGDALRQIAVGGSIGEKASDQWHDLAEMDGVTESNDWIAGSADIEEGDASSRANDSGKFDEESAKIAQVAQGEATRNTIDRSHTEWQAQDVGLDAWRVAAVHDQHPE